MGNSSANVRIIDLPPMTVAGLGADFVSALVKGGNAFTVLPQLWGRVSDIIDSVGLAPEPSQSKLWMVGAIGETELPAYDEAGDEAEGALHYFAGVRVDIQTDENLAALVAAGLQVRRYAGGRYAVCEHLGSLDVLGDTTAWFYQTWLPAEGLTERYDFHFEIYDERFDMGSPTSVVMICAPVK